MRWLSPVLAVLIAIPAAPVAEAQNVAPMLNIVIVEGDGAINNIRQRTAREPIVQVEDQNHKPVAGAAVVFALVSVIQNFGLRSDLHESQTRVATLQTRIDADRRTVERDRRMLTDLTASDAKRYTVAYGTVVTRGDHVYLALGSLPPLAPGKVYQAWTLARGAKTVAPSVTFTPSVNGLTLVPIPEVAGNLDAVAVSVEPQGGSRQPTTKPAFVQPLT